MSWKQGLSAVADQSKRYVVYLETNWADDTDDHDQAILLAKRDEGTIYVREDYFRPTIEGHVATLRSFLQWYKGEHQQYADDTDTFVINRYLTHIGFVTHDSEGKPLDAQTTD